MSGVQSTVESEGLWSGMSVPEFVWDDGIVNFLAELDSDIVVGDVGVWRVSCGAYRSGLSQMNEVPVEPLQDIYLNPSSSGIGRRNKFEECVTFTFEWVDEYFRSEWVSHLTNVIVGVDSGYRSDEFFVTGRLIKPIVSESLSEVIAHLESELEKVEERLCVVRRFEELYGIHKRRYCDDPYCLSNVSGVGEKSIKRLARRFGSYSNVLYNNREVLEACLSTAYGNSSDIEQLIENISDVALEFKKEESKWDVTIKDLLEFPYKCVGGFAGPVYKPHPVSEEYK